MRIVSYNILDGGTGREDALREVIAAQRPDVVALVEADDPGVVERLADALRMDFVHAPGNAHASALLSRWTIRESVNHALVRPGLEKSLLEATVADPAGREWVVGVIHLHARAYEADEQQREAELEVVLDAFAPHRAAGRPHLLCGDFNANSPTQRIDPARVKPKTVLAWEANGGQLPRRVVQRLLDNGYVDTLHAARGAEAETLGTFTTEHPGQRVDYVFAFGAVNVTSAWVEQGEVARRASDHFPVGAVVA